MANRRFKRGSGCFKCRSCGKLTRDVDGNASSEQCPRCDAVGLYGNGLSDNGILDDQGNPIPDPWAYLDNAERFPDGDAVRIEYDRLTRIHEQREGGSNAQN